MIAISGLDQIYIINVREFSDRRRHITAQLARFELEGEFVHDWDVGDITSEIDAQYFRNPDLSPGQKSCALKHLTALQRILERGQNSALVLEDDVVLAGDFCEGVRAAMSERSRHPGPQVIFIGSGGNFYTSRSQRRPDQRLYPATRGRFADSYIVGADVARLRLNWISRHGISRPIDNEFERMDLECGVQMLWLEDPVAEQGSKNGLFQTALEQAPPRFLQKLKFSWEKLRRKYLYQLWR